MQSKMTMTVENVQNAINKLESIDPYEEYAYEKAFMAYKIIKHLPILVYTIEDEVEVFRARTHFENAFFESKSDISLAPNESIKHVARCNRPFQSKFYCGENRPTAFMELVNYWSTQRNIGESLYVTIGRWKVKRPFSALIITSPDPDKRVSKFDQLHGAVLDDFLNQYEGEFKEANIILYRYLFEKFRKPAKDDPLTYLITSAYCNNALFDAQFDVDAVYYPSVPFGGQGVNFAFNNQFIKDGHIELLGALRNEFTVYQVKDNIKGFHEISAIEAKSVNDEAGTIIW